MIKTGKLRPEDKFDLSATILLPLPATGLVYTYKRVIRVSVVKVERRGKVFDVTLQADIEEPTAFVERGNTVAEVNPFNNGRVDTRIL